MEILRKMNRKGITPLMITVILISFAVATGAVVMNLGSAQVEEEAQCAIDIGMKFSVIGGADQFCYNEATQEVKFTLENGVNIKVEGLIMNIIGANKAETFELNEAKITKAGTYLGAVRFDKAAGGDIKQVKIIPKVVMYDEEQICSEKALVTESVRLC